jgi:hypothetical protein
MEAVVDAIIGQVEAFLQAPVDVGGLDGKLDIKAIYFGDPGVLPVSNFPCVTVEPESNRPVGESTGFDKRELTVYVGIHIDAREYYDTDADEATGDRMLVEASEALSTWFRKREVRQLDGTVQDLSVQETVYQPIRRGPSIISKSSRTTFAIRKQYLRVK